MTILNHLYPAPLGGATALSLMLCACDLGGGLNQNENNAGNQDDGVEVGQGSIAIAPQGGYFLSTNRDALVFGNIETGAVRELSALSDPGRLGFAHGSETIFLTLGGIYAPEEDALSAEGELVAFGLRQDEVLWQRPVQTEREFVASRAMPLTDFPLLSIAKNDSVMVVAEPHRAILIDPQSGQTLRSEDFGAREVVDVDITPGEDAVLVTLSHAWLEGGTPETHIVSIPLQAPEQASETIKVPNCSSELIIDPSGARAFLAPTTCEQDPISIIDLAAKQFVKNLPGFGPVSIAPKGELVVGFLDLDNIDESLFDDPEDIPEGAQYHLMFIDPSDMSYDFLEVGDELPRYAPTPDGRALLVDPAGWFDDGRVRILDIDNRTLSPTAGPGVSLDEFVLFGDSSRAFLLDDGLYDLKIPEKTIDTVPITFTPSALNLTPDDANLLLRENDQEKGLESVHVFDTATGSILRTLKL
jgi:hypothetical protein